MRSLLSPSWVPVLLLCASCSSFGMKGQAGYAQMRFGGDLALSPTAGGVALGAIRQDVESGLGLGDDSGSPYGRLELDFGLPVLAASGFLFHDSGTGQLNATFGQIAAGTTVASELEFANLKTSLAFDIDLGPVKVAPGIAIDLFDLGLSVQDSLGLVKEDVDVLAPVPMAFVRATLDLGTVALVADAGYITLDVDDVDGSFLDAELWLEVRPLPGLFLFSGYRYISIEGDGIADGQAFEVDLHVRGWQIGGGFRF